MALTSIFLILFLDLCMGDEARKVRGSRWIGGMDHRPSDVGHIALLLPQAFLRSVLQDTSSLSLVLPLLDLPRRLELPLLRNPHVALLRRSIHSHGAIDTSRSSLVREGPRDWCCRAYDAS